MECTMLLLLGSGVCICSSLHSKVLEAGGDQLRMVCLCIFEFSMALEAVGDQHQMAVLNVGGLDVDHPLRLVQF
eukprot:1878932-Amphidinium_carterae.2